MIAARAQGLAPGITASLLGLVNRAMPRDPGREARRANAGWESQTPVTDSFVTALGRRAAQDLLQYPAPRHVRAEEPPAAASG
jgi:hypothetical protein